MPTYAETDAPSDESTRILVIDDDVELCELLADYLQQEGLELEAVHHGAEGLERARSGAHSMVLLDVMLPGLSGFELLRKLREESWIPVIMLTARGDDVDRIVGLELGADDYLPKPFNPRELVARIRAIQRRLAPQPEQRTDTNGARLALGDLELDVGAHAAYQDGQPVSLTSAEFSMLEALIRAAGTAVSRELLARKVLGRELAPFDRSVDVHISNLRKKLGNQLEETERIKTIRGVGYLYAATEPKEP